MMNFIEESLIVEFYNIYKNKRMIRLYKGIHSLGIDEENILLRDNIKYYFAKGCLDSRLGKEIIFIFNHIFLADAESTNLYIKFEKEFLKSQKFEKL